MLHRARGPFRGCGAGAVPIVADDASLTLPDVDAHNNASSSLNDGFANSGAADEAVAATTITGPDAARFAIGKDSCAGTKLVPLGRCSVEVVFTPASPGSKAATLELTDADGGTSAVP